MRRSLAMSPSLSVEETLRLINTVSEVLAERVQMERKLAALRPTWGRPRDDLNEWPRSSSAADRRSTHPAGASVTDCCGSPACCCALWEIPAPMLAASGRPVGSLVGWTAEFKADGFRCQVAVSSARRVARTRGGHDIADRLPELEVLSHVGVDMILDGEAIVGAGRPADFQGLAGAVASRRRDRTWTSFVAFDLWPSTGSCSSNGRTLTVASFSNTSAPSSRRR